MKDLSQEIPEQDIEKALKGIKIPSPPQIIVDLQMELAAININIANIETIVSKDVGIAGKYIMRLAYLACKMSLMLSIQLLFKKVFLVVV